jgi:ribosomal protein S18 acetylase RimI-like enzyme
LTSSSIKDHQQVLSLLKKNPKYLEIFSTYSPAHRFIIAEVEEHNLSFSVRDEDGSIFAMALGRNPKILECDRVATSRNVKVDPASFVHRADWDFYSIDTKAFADFEMADETNNFEEIKTLLENHAPNSSVWPGNQEVLFWGAIRNGDQLVATGALVKWRTGQVMFASIATHSDFRSKGLAQMLISRMLSTVYSQGIEHVGLGVFAGNVSAKRAYEKIGFSLIGEFSSYQKKEN